MNLGWTLGEEILFKVELDERNDGQVKTKFVRKQ